MTLTTAAIEAAKPGQTIRDTDVPGLQLRAFAGRKSFYVYYRTRAGDERRPKLGDVGVFTLNEARRAARKILQQVALGKDPGGQWKADRDSMTVNELCDIYLERRAAKRGGKDETAPMKHYVSLIRKHVGAHKVATLCLADGERLHAAISAKTPVQANRVVKTLSAALTLAEKHELRSAGSNFCKHIEKNPETKRERYLLPGEEAKAVGAEIRKRLYGSKHEETLFVLLLLLTGARRGELGNAKAEWRDGHVLVIPPDAHKTGSKTGKRRVIYLPDAAVAALDDPLRPKHDRRGYLLGVSSPRHLWEDIRKAAGCTDLRLHDLRHTFASFGLGQQLSLSTIGPLLGHASPQTTNRYAHLIDGPAKTATNLIADSVEAALAEEGD